MADTLIPTPALHRWVEDLWLAAGCHADEARLTADHLVGANLAGHDSHGVGMVPRYVSSWLANELQLNQHVAIGSDSGAMLSLDANRGMGRGYFFLARQARQVQPPYSDDLEEQELLELSRDELATALSKGDFKIMAWAAILALALNYLANPHTG